MRQSTLAQVVYQPPSAAGEGPKISRRKHLKRCLYFSLISVAILFFVALKGGLLFVSKLERFDMVKRLKDPYGSTFLYFDKNRDAEVIMDV